MLALPILAVSQEAKFAGKEISFPSLDGLKITADLYQLQDKSAPLIILFHQAGYSRGEYRSIAPKLIRLGFSCLAIDQRSGAGVNEIFNETNARATGKKMPTAYIDALLDVEAALEYAQANIAIDVILWGSSYSASQVIYMGAKYGERLKGILAFSPGEYFLIDGKQIDEYAKEVIVPVFITSAKSEHDNWKIIYDNIPGAKSNFLPTTEGAHGSSALWSSTIGEEAYWTEVTNFLKQLK